ncbi:unnamed protein product [Microthlaspi erraticum]|uniref:F-box domain-containing protein n=1 Tax=Microthlaspi erraticum TaxID=1685480 RepID=A0A6D2K0U8_9BRAS|nr:unnamed protein product [Microthlaspi erraticum]
MGMSFRLAAVKVLTKKMKRSKVEGRAKRKRRSLLKPVPRPAVAAAAATATAVPGFPEDVLMEILARLPAKSLMRFKCVSKLWSSIISSRYLTNLFLRASSPLRFMYLTDKYGHALLLTAAPQYAAEKFCGLHIEVTVPEVGGCLVNALRGLMCFRIGGRRYRICNVTTKQQVELPLVKSSLVLEDGSNTWSHFGYDPIQDAYKVLSLVWGITQDKVMRWEHQVLVLGPGASWRRSNTTQSVAPHRPYSQGISMDGVLYYGAWAGEESTCVLVSFDMSSEDFNLIELPLEAGITWDTRATNLMKYRGKIAVFDYTRLSSEGSIDLWVVEHAGKSQWSNKTTLVPPIRGIALLPRGDLFIQGTSREGTIRCFVNRFSSMHILFDLETSETIRQVVLSSEFRGHPLEPESLHMSYCDLSESIMYLEA